MSTWRTQWTKAGGIGPEWRDFRYAVAAENYAAIMRELGHEHVTIHQLDSTETETR